MSKSRKFRKASDAEIASLVEVVDGTRERWEAAEVTTLEQQDARQNNIRDALRELDNAIWSRRKRGETVATARARLAPNVVW